MGLLKPHDGLMPEAQGKLLLKWVGAERPIAGLNFDGAIVPESSPIQVDWRTYEAMNREAQEAYGYLDHFSDPYAFLDGCLDGASLVG